MRRKEVNPLLKSFFPAVDCIADLFGPNCEVALHDLSDLERSIIKIRNGHVMGRKEGDNMSDLGFDFINENSPG